MVQNIWFVLFFFMSFYSHGQEFGKPWLYTLIVEPIVGVDSFLNQIEGLEIKSCEIFDSEYRMRENQYDGLGSCVYKRLPFFDIGENSRDEKVVRVHASVSDHPFELEVSWTSITVGEILFGLEDNPIQFLFKTEGISLQDFVYILLSGSSDTSQIENKNTLMSFFKKTEDITQLKLQIVPLENTDLRVQLSLLDSIGTSIYDYFIYTNYQNEEDEIFIVSEDIYFSDEFIKQRL